jgi:hypothetical protein
MRFQPNPSAAMQAVMQPNPSIRRLQQLLSHPEILISECEPFFPQEI